VKFTVIGANGLIGSALCRDLETDGIDVLRVTRGQQIPAVSLGHVVHAAGVTGDFLVRRRDGFQSHVAIVEQVLRTGDFDSFTFLSSTRLYKRADSTHEDARIPVQPELPDDYYTTTKLMGEALCHSAEHPAARVIRLSNVVGPQLVLGNFLFEVITGAAQTRHVTFSSSLDSGKDYVWLGDVVSAIRQISVGGMARTYNVASGRNVHHREIADLLRTELGAVVEVAATAPVEDHAPISIGRISDELGFTPTPALPLIHELVRQAGELAQ
jgi:nucleoside-diphosphate-sugar epimerase